LSDRGRFCADDLYRAGDACRRILDRLAKTALHSGDRAGARRHCNVGNAPQRGGFVAPCRICLPEPCRRNRAGPFSHGFVWPPAGNGRAAIAYLRQSRSNCLRRISTRREPSEDPMRSLLSRLTFAAALALAPLAAAPALAS